ncbi:hypothetical protein HPB52_016989 [Rhipicephalus sanguineus]|uniref:Uncharacterized protein n=1 Tax=Rhipicephalus sanguineus TaxID=34632 RepID=A0A9D4PK30_RHISA|nr:hypothetical protein HPB52_016989 [Rhipicephalus sanguineus]
MLQPSITPPHRAPRSYNRATYHRAHPPTVGIALLEALRSVGLQSSAKSVARQLLQRVVRAYPGDTPSLIADLSAKYLQLLPPGIPSPPLACYSGAPNPKLDAEFTQAEVFAALQKLHTTCTTGPDCIPNK